MTTRAFQKIYTKIDNITKATVTLRAAPGLTLYKVAPDGARIGKIPATYADGAYTFTVAVKPGEAAPTMVYELAP